MAEDLEKGDDVFCCSVCLDLFSDPVTTPCGHNYCLRCIDGCWDQQEQKGEYSCPQCRETFVLRPSLKRNTVLVELMEKSKTTGIQVGPPAPNYAKPGDVECDFCAEMKLKAIKSCLKCEVSLCETHIQPHYNVPALKRHKLVSATRLQDRICPQHGNPLQVYCRDDQTCICVLCTMDEHKGHNTISSTAARKEKETEVDAVEEKFQEKIHAREKNIGELTEAMKLHEISAEKALENSDKIFSELQQYFEKTHSEVNQLIRSQQKAAMSCAEDTLEELKREMADLRTGDDKLKQLSKEDDHIQFLQTLQCLLDKQAQSVFQHLNLSPNLIFDGVNQELSDLKNKMENLSKKTIENVSGKVNQINIVLPMGQLKGQEFQNSHPLTSTSDKANIKTCLSEGNRKTEANGQIPEPSFQTSPAPAFKSNLDSSVKLSPSPSLQPSPAPTIATSLSSSINSNPEPLSGNNPAFGIKSDQEPSLKFGNIFTFKNNPVQSSPEHSLQTKSGAKGMPVFTFQRSSSYNFQSSPTFSIKDKSAPSSQNSHKSSLTTQSKPSSQISQKPSLMSETKSSTQISQKPSLTSETKPCSQSSQKLSLTSETNPSTQRSQRSSLGTETKPNLHSKAKLSLPSSSVFGLNTSQELIFQTSKAPGFKGNSESSVKLSTASSLQPNPAPTLVTSLSSSINSNPQPLSENNPVLSIKSNQEPSLKFDQVIKLNTYPVTSGQEQDSKINLGPSFKGIPLSTSQSSPWFNVKSDSTFSLNTKTVAKLNTKAAFSVKTSQEPSPQSSPQPSCLFSSALDSPLRIPARKILTAQRKNHDSMA